VLLLELGPGPLDDRGILELGFDANLDQVDHRPVRELYDIGNRRVIEHWLGLSWIPYSTKPEKHQVVNKCGILGLVLDFG
jgi:hypothetical protein